MRQVHFYFWGPKNISICFQFLLNSIVIIILLLLLIIIIIIVMIIYNDNNNYNNDDNNNNNNNLLFKEVCSQQLSDFKSNRKAMNRNWSNQKANPALKTKAGNK